MTEPSNRGEKRYMCPRSADIHWGPLDLCVIHAEALTVLTVRRARHKQAFRYAVVRENEYLLSRANNVEDEINAGIEEFTQEAARHNERWQRKEDRRLARAEASVVYYVCRGDLIKIGTTSNLGPRLIAINGGVIVPPQATVKLLATESGGVEVEAQRHAQFATDRVAGEWFKASPALTEHINQLPCRQIDTEMRTHGLAQ